MCFTNSPVISEAETGDTAVRPGLVRAELEPAPREPGPGPCWLVETDNPCNGKQSAIIHRRICLVFKTLREMSFMRSFSNFGVYHPN